MLKIGSRVVGASWMGQIELLRVIGGFVYHKKKKNGARIRC